MLGRGLCRGLGWRSVNGGLEWGCGFGRGSGWGRTYVAGKGFGVAEAGGEVVKVVVPGLVEAGVGGGDTGDGVEGGVEWLGGC